MGHLLDAELAHAMAENTLTEIAVTLRTAQTINYRFAPGIARDLVRFTRDLREANTELETSIHLYQLQDMNNEFEDTALSLMISNMNEVQALIYDIDDVLKTLHPENPRH